MALTRKSNLLLQQADEDDLVTTWGDFKDANDSESIADAISWAKRAKPGDSSVFDGFVGDWFRLTVLSRRM